jgi:hypothetical protein
MILSYSFPLLVNLAQMASVEAYFRADLREPYRQASPPVRFFLRQFEKDQSRRYAN